MTVDHSFITKRYRQIEQEVNERLDQLELDPNLGKIIRKSQGDNIEYLPTNPCWVGYFKVCLQIGKTVEEAIAICDQLHRRTRDEINDWP
jgi:hypothetical protein